MTTPIVEQIYRQMISEIEPRIGNNIRDNRSVLIGNPVTAQIHTDDTKTQIFVHTPGDITQGTGRISSSDILNELLTFNRPILIKLNDTGDYQFAGLETSLNEIYAAGTSTAIDQTPVQLNQLKYAILHRQSSLILLVDGAIYGDNLVRDITTPDFASGTVQDTDGNNIVVPTTNLKAIGVLVQLDPLTSTLSYKQSAEYASSISLSDAYDNGFLPIRDGNRQRIGYFELINGMTEFTDANVLPLPGFLGLGGLWSNPIIDNIIIGDGFQQHAIEQTIASGGVLTVEGEYWIDNSLTIEDGGQLIIADGGQMTIRPVITDQPSLNRSTLEVSSNYTVKVGDGTIAFDASSGTITGTLPPVATVKGITFVVGRINTGGGNVILDPDGSETINGDLTKTLTAAWSFYALRAVGTASVDWAFG